MEAISRAEQEGRLADAEKLLNAAMQKEEAATGSQRRLSLLLNHLASLEMRQGQYDEAIAAAEHELAIDKKSYGPESPTVARDLNNLAMFKMARGKPNLDSEAEQDYKQALDIARLNQATRPGLLLMVLNNLSQYYLRRKRADEAERLIDEALQVCRGGPAPKPFQCASFRNLLANAYREEGHPNAAEAMSFDAVASDSSSNGPWRGKLLNLETLARQYDQDRSYDLEETTYRQALALVEANTRPDEPGELPDVMNRLGEILVMEGKNAEAESFFMRALALQEQTYQSKPPRSPLWLDFDYLINLYRTEGCLADIEPVIQQGMAIQEQASGAGNEPFAQLLLTLARVYEEEKKYSDAEPLCERALQIQEADYGSESPRLIGTIEIYARILRKLGKTGEAVALESRANRLRQKHAGQSRH